MNQTAIQDLEIIPNADEQAQEIAKKLVVIKAMIDGNKNLYEAMDKLTLQLNALTTKPVHVTLEDKECVFLHNGIATFLAPEQVVEVNDNFSEKNTVFRVAGVKRFEANVLTKEEYELKLAKEAKKAAKVK